MEVGRTDPGVATTAGSPTSGLSGPSGARSPDEPIPAKVYRYAERFIRQYDHDRDATLDRREWGPRWGFVTTDANMDGQVGLEELVRRIAGYGRHRKIRLMPPLGEGGEVLPRLLNPTTGATPNAGVPLTEKGAAAEHGTKVESSGSERPRRDTKFVVSPARRQPKLPSWFAARDADGDGQLTMAEFAPKPTGATLAEFAQFDRDGDGVITAGEYLRAVNSSGKKEAR